MYGKLFASLYQGTLRGKSDAILVFSNLLAFADSDGFVDKHWRAIAEEVGISVERVKAACIYLESPDPESRSPDADGARILRIDNHRAWGWKIVNHAKYRAIRSEEDRRIQNRDAKRRQRERERGESADVSNGQQPSALSDQAEAEAYIHTDTRREPPVASVPDPEPVIPTLAEVLTLAAMRGVAEEYARNFHATTTEKHGWIVNGKLLKWQERLPRFWSKDRQNFKPTATKPTTSINHSNFDR